MLLTFWSPKAGAGTSVLAAVCASLLARTIDVRVADLDGDQCAIFGLPGDGSFGCSDWLQAGPVAPADALDRIEVAVAPHLTLVPYGTATVADASPEAGAALGVVLRDDERVTVADCGAAVAPSVRALIEVADVSVVVVRDCYLALRRATRDPLVLRAAGMVVACERGRALGQKDIESIVPLPVLATLPIEQSIARLVDCGLVTARPPSPLQRVARRVLDGVGTPGRAGRAA
jgi:hypothetical protein